MKDKKFTYINDYYKRNFKHGMVVRALGELGTAEYGNQYVYVRIMGKIRNFHPNDVEEVK